MGKLTGMSCFLSCFQTGASLRYMWLGAGGVDRNIVLVCVTFEVVCSDEQPVRLLVSCFVGSSAATGGRC